MSESCSWLPFQAIQPPVVFCTTTQVSWSVLISSNSEWGHQLKQETKSSLSQRGLQLPCFLLLFVCLCFPLLIVGSHHSMCVSFPTSSLFLISFGFLSPLFLFYMSVISNPLATQNEGCPLSCPLWSHSSLHISEQTRHLRDLRRWHTATYHPQWELSEPGSKAWARCQHTTERQLGLAGGVWAWQSDPRGAAPDLLWDLEQVTWPLLSSLSPTGSKDGLLRMLEEWPMRAGCLTAQPAMQTHGWLSGWAAAYTHTHTHTHTHIHAHICTCS